MKATAALLAVLLRETRPKVEAIMAIYLQGLWRGYSFASLAWMVKQSAHETGFWQNKGTVQDLNVWGMSRVQSRTTTQIGWRRINETETSGIYTSIWSSVRDRFMWDADSGINGRGDAETYADVVSALYHTSGNYARSVDAVVVSGQGRILTALAIVIPLEVLALSSLLRKLF